MYRSTSFFNLSAAILALALSALFVVVASEIQNDFEVAEPAPKLFFAETGILFASIFKLLSIALGLFQQVLISNRLIILAFSGGSSLLFATLLLYRFLENPVFGVLLLILMPLAAFGFIGLPVILLAG